MDTIPSGIAAPLYPLPYAAALTGLDKRMAGRWLRGYPYSYKGERRLSAPVIQQPPAGVAAKSGVSFEELLTLRLVRAFRERGLGLQTIKKAARIAAENYNSLNPFVAKAFRTDGQHIFVELNRSGDVKGDDIQLVNALTGQHEFQAIVEPSLFRDLVFVGDVPTQWFPRGHEHPIVIRPDRVFGAPHIINTRIQTDVLAEAVTAEGGGDGAIAAVAHWFGVTPDQVAEAVAAEAEWQPPKKWH